MTSTISYPLVVFYDAASRDCARSIEALRECASGGRLQFVGCAKPGIRARDAHGREWTGILALEAAYRAAWDGEVAL